MKFSGKSFIRGVGALGVAAALTIAAPAAFASTSQVTLSSNGSSSGSPAFLGTTTGSPGVKFHAGTASMDCVSATASGNLNLGANANGNDIADISSSVWKKCKALGILSLTVDQVGTWKLNAGDTNSATGVTPVTITNVYAHVYDGSGLCDFYVKGGVDGFFQESDQTLHVTLPTGVAMPPSTTPAALKVDSIVGGANCLNTIATTPGAKSDATFEGVYAITDPSLAGMNIDITQP